MVDEAALGGSWWPGHPSRVVGWDRGVKKGSRPLFQFFSGGFPLTMLAG
jgi:hypothetical protein